MHAVYLLWALVSCLLLPPLLPTSAATTVPPTQHHCIFDELVKASLATPNGKSALVETTALDLTQQQQQQQRLARSSAPTGYGPLRITTITKDLESDRWYCSEVGQRRSDYRGSFVECTANDILTDEKKQILTEKIIPKAIKMHQDRLYVQPLGSVTVGLQTLTTASYCSSIHHPSPVPFTVQDTDFILYISAAPASSSYIAWAGVCGWQADGRPTVGIANVSPGHISDTDYAVRAVAHEILHALGFVSITFAARGMKATIPSLRGKTNLPALQSPSVVRAAREHYGCNTLDFVELEDAGGSGTASSHWKMRNAKDELMTGYAGAMIYSSLTIAAMEDLGFYKGNYDNAEPMAWGKDAGCSFIGEKCINANQRSAVPDMFCDATTPRSVCTVDRQAIGSCAMGRFAVSLPSYAQYFGAANVGGFVAAMDYCPYIAPFFSCSSGDGTTTAEMPGSVTGSHARCLASYRNSEEFILAGGNTRIRAFCAEVECDASTRTYSVKVQGMSSFVACPAGSSFFPNKYSSAFFSGSVYCPAYDEVCGATTASTVTGDSSPAELAPDGTWRALSSASDNYHPFTCERNGTTWTQYNRCTSTANGNRTCLGDYVQDSSGVVHGTSDGYDPCAVSLCTGWYCENERGALLQRYDPLDVDSVNQYNILPTSDPCYCARLGSNGKPITADVTVSTYHTELRVAFGGDGYRYDDANCTARGFVCKASGYSSFREVEADANATCYCCAHRDKPWWSSSLSSASTVDQSPLAWCTEDVNGLVGNGGAATPRATAALYLLLLSTSFVLLFLS